MQEFVQFKSQNRKRMIEINQIHSEDTPESEFWTIEAKWKCGLCHANNLDRKHTFSDKFEFEDHITRFCHICNEELTSVEAINRHFASHHYEGNQNPGVFQKRTFFLF